MARYKCVPGPTNLTIKSMKRELLEEAIGEYGIIIERETVGGWELDGMYPVQVTKAAEILNKEQILYSNILVFKKEE